ncbi:DUF998 domain-containing protein [Cellulomonas sp. PhB150]|uniref:DUF998 domain-containing protein n=1 Tax=Cellulomonas sp. PhB150 TaxID=2485188 RepID=UPI000FC1BEA9|nr:DUF998 domain-containing protein [Cellulomonas sp. PhB150]ROS31090.1 uncharacterized protein DUF998 [Cellulomonas sp. PhB150]
MSTGSQPRLHPLPLVVGIVAALLYCNFLIDWVLRGFEGMGEIVSELESPGEPNAMLLRVTDVVCAVLVVVLVVWARALLPRGAWREVFTWSTVLFAIGAALAAIVPEPCGPGVPCDAPHQVLQRDVHGYASVASDTALFLGVFAVIVVTWRVGPAWLRRVGWVVLVLGGLVSSLAFGYYHRYPDPDWAVGASQRIHIAFIAAWIFCLGLFSARAEPPSAPETSPAPAHDRTMTR